MQWRQEKDQNPDAKAEVGEPAHKATVDNAMAARIPAWADASGGTLPAGLQAKLMVNQPGDVYEQEADRVADQVMRIADGTSSAMRKDLSVMPKASEGEQASHEAPPIVNQALSSAGQPLDAGTQETMGARFGTDFSHVRVHADEQANDSAQAIHARAYTVGNDVVFGGGQYKPGTSEGQRLLAHELTHVVQQTASLASPKTVQRRLNPEDASSEMVGQQFSVTQDFSAPFGKIHPGDVLVVKSWVNSSTTVTVAYSPPHEHADVNFSVPKAILTPVHIPTPGIASYHAGLPAVQSTVTKGQASIESLRAKESTYKSPKGRELFTAELKRLEGLQTTRVATLNRRLIQETMFNRFDPLIAKWTNFYNEKFKGMHWSPLDPNLVKSIIFNESQMGTSGRYLESAPPWHHPVTTRFNLASAQDSAGAVLLLMMDEMHPDFRSRFHLENIEKDLAKAQAEFRALRDRARHIPLNTTESDRLKELDRLSGPKPNANWETFIWEYHHPDGFFAAVSALFASGPSGKHLNEDYDFWIHTAVRWLFDKRRGVHSWTEAVRAYNGSGKAAEHYQTIVVGRAKKAKESGEAGIIPEGI